MKKGLFVLGVMLDFLIKESKVPDGLGFWGMAGRLSMVLLRWSEHAPVLNAARSTNDAALLQAYLKVACRPTLPYLSTNFNAPERLSLLQAHDRFVRTRIGTDLFARLVSRPIVLWSQEMDGSFCTISLAGPCPHREGGLSLVFAVNDVPLYKSAFSFVNSSTLGFPPSMLAAPNTPLIYVGQVQGFPGQYDAIRAVSKKCHDVTPADMLMAALLGLAAAFDVSFLAAVKSENCLSRERMQQKAGSFDYAAFWQGHWGALEGPGHYLLPLPLQEKPLSEIKSNHRGRTLAKRGFKRDIAQQAEAALRMQPIKPQTTKSTPGIVRRPRVAHG
ncbi:MAG: DUF535 family protein [Aquabacterium sp.]